MGKTKKSLKKFSRKLPGVIKQRRAYSDKKRKIGTRKNDQSAADYYSSASDEIVQQQQNEVVSSCEKEDIFQKDFYSELDGIKSDDEDKGQAGKHKQQLVELEQKDPDFFQYLQKNDLDLLNFDDDEEEEEEEEVKEDKGITVDGGKKNVSVDIVRKWKEFALEKKSFTALRKIISVFRVGCHIGEENDDDDDGDEKKPKKAKSEFVVESAEVFNEIMLVVFSDIKQILDRQLDVTPSVLGSNKKPLLPSKSLLWNKYQSLLKVFLFEMVNFIGQISDPEMLLYVLTVNVTLIPYFACFPVISKRLLKASLQIWASVGNKDLVLGAYANIRQLTIFCPLPFVDTALKGIYWVYFKNTRVMNTNTAPAIDLMVSCLVDLYGLDFVHSYQNAFVYIRQLSIHLKRAIQGKTSVEFNKKSQNRSLKKIKNKKSIKKSDEANLFRTICCWQFVNALRAWVEILMEYPDQEAMKQLIYPVVQMIMGFIDYVPPSSRYFGFRFVCISYLLGLARNSKVFVNVIPWLFSVLENSDFNSKPLPSMEKPIDFKVTLKIPKTLVKTSVFQESVFLEVYRLLLEYLEIYSYQIGFPELSIPVILFLKKYAKSTSNPVPKYRLALLKLLEKINCNYKYIATARTKSGIGPSETEKCSKFLVNDEKRKKSPLSIYLKQFKRNNLIMFPEKQPAPSFQVLEKGENQNQNQNQNQNENQNQNQNQKNRNQKRKRQRNEFSSQKSKQKGDVIKSFSI